MGQIKVIIQVLTGANKWSVELPDDVQMKRLIPALVTKLNLPKVNPIYLWELDRASPDESIVYELYHQQTSRRLHGEDTLASIGVREGDTLVLLPTLGWREFAPVPIEHHITLVSGKRFLEVAVVVAIQVEEMTTAVIIPKHLSLRELNSYILREITFARKRHVPSGISFPWKIFNETTEIMIDTNSNLTVGDVILSGDLLRVMKLQDRSKPAAEQSLTIKITREDIEGRHKP